MNQHLARGGKQAALAGPAFDVTQTLGLGRSSLPGLAARTPRNADSLLVVAAQDKPMGHWAEY